jgi:hypothetical protein
VCALCPCQAGPGSSVARVHMISCMHARIHGVTLTECKTVSTPAESLAVEMPQGLLGVQVLPLLSTLLGPHCLCFSASPPSPNTTHTHIHFPIHPRSTQGGHMGA